MIRNGLPDVLRGEVWQLLAGCHKEPDIMDTYRLLLGKVSRSGVVSETGLSF